MLVKQCIKKKSSSFVSYQLNLSLAKNTQNKICIKFLKMHLNIVIIISHVHQIFVPHIYISFFITFFKYDCVILLVCLVKNKVYINVYLWKYICFFTHTHTHKQIHF